MDSTNIPPDSFPHLHYTLIDDLVHQGIKQTLCSLMPFGAFHDTCSSLQFQLIRCTKISLL